MNYIIFSKSFIVREIFEMLIKINFENFNIIQVTNIMEIATNKIDLLILDSYNYEDKEVIEILKFKLENKSTKVIVIDSSMNIKLFLLANEYNIESYISDNYDKEDLVRIINYTLRGHKFYDARIVDKLIYTNLHQQNEDYLTKREVDVVNCIENGMDNYEISINLNISENTVKKHISSILRKLKLKNKREIIIYMKEKESLNSHSSYK